MPARRNLLQVYKTGMLTVLGFAGIGRTEQIHIAECRDEIMHLIDRHGVRILALDLTGVRLVPGGLLGLLASLKRSGVEIHLYNPSEDVKEVLRITNFGVLFDIHTLAV